MNSLPSTSFFSYMGLKVMERESESVQMPLSQLIPSSYSEIGWMFLCIHSSSNHVIWHCSVPIRGVLLSKCYVYSQEGSQSIITKRVSKHFKNELHILEIKTVAGFWNNLFCLEMEWCCVLALLFTQPSTLPLAWVPNEWGRKQQTCLSQ